MEELRSLFGEDSLSFDEFSAKLNASGIKLANIKAGGYVDKGKYDKLSNEFEKYKAENNSDKYADYEEVKAENEKLKAEKIELQYSSIVSAAGVDDKFKKFVLSEVKSLVTEEKNFETALSEYVKENEQFLKPKTEHNPNDRVFQMDSQANFENTKTNSTPLDKLSMEEYIKRRQQK